MQNAKCKMQKSKWKKRGSRQALVAVPRAASRILPFAFCTLHFALLPCLASSSFLRLYFVKIAASLLPPSGTTGAEANLSDRAATFS
jgi:hypothetical protein